MQTSLHLQCALGNWDRLRKWMQRNGLILNLEHLCTCACITARQTNGKSSLSRTLFHQVLKKVTQSCLTLCDHMDCSLPGSSVQGIFQERILEWVAISFSRGSSRPRDWTWVSRIVARRFTIREVHQGSPPSVSSSCFYVSTLCPTLLPRVW